MDCVLHCLCGEAPRNPRRATLCQMNLMSCVPCSQLSLPGHRVAMLRLCQLSSALLTPTTVGLIFSCWYLARAVVRTKCRIPAVGDAVVMDKQWQNSLTIVSSALENRELQQEHHRHYLSQWKGLDPHRNSVLLAAYNQLDPINDQREGQDEIQG